MPLQQRGHDARAARRHSNRVPFARASDGDREGRRTSRQRTCSPCSHHGQAHRVFTRPPARAKVSCRRAARPTWCGSGWPRAAGVTRTPQAAANPARSARAGYARVAVCRARRLQPRRSEWSTDDNRANCARFGLGAGAGGTCACALGATRRIVFRPPGGQSRSRRQRDGQREVGRTESAPARFSTAGSRARSLPTVSQTWRPRP